MNLNEVKEKIDLGFLVHPGARWHDFSKFLKSILPRDEDLPNPLILGGYGSNDFSKNLRLKEQLKVADDNGLLIEALEFLATVDDDVWVKSDGNLDPDATSF